MRQKSKQFEKQESKYLGVSWFRTRRMASPKWRAQACGSGQRYLGTFSTQLEAATAVNLNSLANRPEMPLPNPDAPASWEELAVLTGRMPRVTLKTQKRIASVTPPTKISPLMAVMREVSALRQEVRTQRQAEQPAPTPDTTNGLPVAWSVRVEQARAKLRQAATELAEVIQNSPAA